MPPRPIGSFVSRWLRSSRTSGAARVFRLWEDRVDAAIRQRTRLAEYRSGTLVIEVESSTYLHELSHFRRPELLRILADEGVSDLRFRLMPRR